MSVPLVFGKASCALDSDSVKVTIYQFVLDGPVLHVGVILATLGEKSTWLNVPVDQSSRAKNCFLSSSIRSDERSDRKVESDFPVSKAAQALHNETLQVLAIVTLRYTLFECLERAVADLALVVVQPVPRCVVGSRFRPPGRLGIAIESRCLAESAQVSSNSLSPRCPHRRDRRRR